MKWAICVAAAIAVFGGDGAILSAQEAAESQTKNLDPYCQEVRRLVRRYYPEATVTASYDEKADAEKIHFEYNTQIFLMRYRGKDGLWQKPVEVRGPYVGGIWCDMTLQKGRYAGDVANAEKGVTESGPDFYSRLIAPFSEDQDRHMKVVLRYPGGTPPEFLERFETLVKGFEDYVEKAVE